MFRLRREAPTLLPMLTFMFLVLHFLVSVAVESIFKLQWECIKFSESMTELAHRKSRESRDLPMGEHLISEARGEGVLSRICGGIQLFKQGFAIWTGLYLFLPDSGLACSYVKTDHHSM
jgi:hypothetical protein